MSKFTLVPCDYALNDNALINKFTEEDYYSSRFAWVGFSEVSGFHLHWYLVKETQRDIAAQYWKDHPDLHQFPIKTYSYEYMTLADKYNSQRIADTEPFAEDEGLSDKQMFRLITSKIPRYVGKHCVEFTACKDDFELLLEISWSELDDIVRINASRIIATLAKYSGSFSLVE